MAVSAKHDALATRSRQDATQQIARNSRKLNDRSTHWSMIPKKPAPDFDPGWEPVFGKIMLGQKSHDRDQEIRHVQHE